MSEVRINKYLASAGVAARRKIDEMIERGKVTVNGRRAILGMKVDPDKDEIIVDGEKFAGGLDETEKSYIILYKPRRVVSTVADTHERKTVLDLVDSEKRLYPVGRLDFESEGLMLLTNDGDLANRLMHPRYHIPKTYLVNVIGGLDEKKLYALRNGVRLTDGKTAPAAVEIISKNGRQSTVKITISEGRNRQIRRMAEKLHLHVSKLKRIEIGPVILGDMASGNWRELTPTEVQSLKAAVVT